MRTLVVGCFLTALIGVFQPAQTTQVQQLSVEELGSVASKVVRGEVATVHSYWNPQRTKIFTEIVVAAAETYKGTAAGTIRILQLGGTVDGVRVTVHGALGWTPGEEVLLFLESYRDDRFVVTGLSQGKFNVVRDPGSGEAFVARVPLEGVEVVGGEGARAVASEIEKIPLRQFVRRSLGREPERHQD
jgi:hypothetical protein